MSVTVPKRRVRRSSEDAQHLSPFTLTHVPSCAKCGAHDHVTEKHSEVIRRKGMCGKPGRKAQPLKLSKNLNKRLARMLHNMEIMCKLIRNMGIVPATRRRKV